MLRAAIIAISVLTIASCNYRIDKLGAATGPGPGDDWYTWLDTRVLKPKCASCHMGKTAEGGVDVSTRDLLVASSVVPGNPDGSKLYHSVASKRMPKGMMGPLSDVEIATIAEWIRRGAKGPAKPIEEELPEPNFDSLRKYLQSKGCMGCHGAEKPEADLNLTKYSGWEGVIVKGEPDESSLYLKIESGAMPPTDPPTPLPKAAIKTLRQWIVDGAPEK